MLGALATLIQHWGAELFQMKKAKSALAVKVDDTKIVRFMQVLHSDIEMSGIPLFHQVERQLVRDELVDALCTNFLEKPRIGQ